MSATTTTCTGLHRPPLTFCSSNTSLSPRLAAQGEEYAHARPQRRHVFDAKRPRCKTLVFRRNQVQAVQVRMPLRVLCLWPCSAGSPSFCQMHDTVTASVFLCLCMMAHKCAVSSLVLLSQP